MRGAVSLGCPEVGSHHALRSSCFPPLPILDVMRYLIFVVGLVSLSLVLGWFLRRTQRIEVLDLEFSALPTGLKKLAIEFAWNGYSVWTPPRPSRSSEGRLKSSEKS